MKRIVNGDLNQEKNPINHKKTEKHKFNSAPNKVTFGPYFVPRGGKANYTNVQSIQY